MRLSDLSIKRPVLAWMIMYAMIIFGAVSFGRLGISYLPDIDFPVLSVQVTWEGAAPELMEAEIVDRIERRLITVEGLQEMSSSVRQGSARINLEFDIDRNVDAALQEVQASLGRLSLPTGIDPPIVRKSNPDQDPILWIGLGGDKPLNELFVLADQTIVDRLQLLPGVGEVFLGGTMERNLRIWVDANKLKKYQLTMVDVREAIAANHSEGAAGYLQDERYEKNLRVLGEASNIDQIKDIQITRRGGSPIYFSTIRLRDVARVEDGMNDFQRITRINGKPGLSIGIRKQIGANTVAVGEAVIAEVEQIKKTLPPGTEMEIAFNGVNFVRESIEETEFTLILAGILTAVVCWIFLGNWTSTFNVILSIPTSIIGTFLVLYFMGFTLNLFTLLALSLAIGIVVDDNIMVMENIVRHFDLGKDKVKAAREGTREITFAALAATVAVIAIFLPVAFMEGIIGKFFFQFGVTLSAAVALSLVDALTLTPMRASRFLSKGKSKFFVVRFVEGTMEILSAIYRAFLEKALKHRWITMGVSLLIFALSLSAYYFLNKEFVPSQDQSQFGMRIQTPIGSSLEYTSQKAFQVEQHLSKQPEVARFLTIVGGFSGGESSSGTVFVSLVPAKDRSKKQEEVMSNTRDFVKSVDSLKASLFDFSTRGLTSRRGYPVEFSIRGGEWADLKIIAEKIKADLEKTGLVTDVDMDYRLGMPEVQVIPDRRAAALRGITMSSIVDTVGSAIGGTREGRFTNDGRRYDVRLRLQSDQWRNPDDVRKLNVRNQYGELIPLSQIARIEIKPTVQTLTRIDRQRAITVQANMVQGKSQAEALNQAEAISRKYLTAGYSYFPGGGSKGMDEAFGSLYGALWLGLIVAYMVLAAQFNSFLHPISVMLALPFSVSGAFLALFVTGHSINLYSMIGIILLMGIAKKNSIMLVEFANELRYKHKAGVDEALLEAASVRLRPIVMTTVSSIAAALPPALAIGPGAESRIPMAIAVIGGISLSTLLTLFVVPAAYSLLARFEKSNGA